MRKLVFSILLLLLCPRFVAAQASGVGNIGCPGQTITGTAATSGTANNTVLATVTATPCPAVLVQLDQTTTFTGGAITFNSSNDLATNYTAVPVAQVLNQSSYVQLTNPYTLVASTNQAFLILLNGATYFQVKLTTAITGSGTVTPYVTPVGLPPGLSLDASGNVKVNLNANSFGTVTVSGTVTTTPPSNASTNVAQFGGNAVATGTGAGGSGIPRVTISNDSSLAANQSVNVAQVNGNTTSTATTGVQKVGIVGNAGAAVDQAPGSAIPANVVMEGLSDGANARAANSDTSGRQLVRQYPDTATTSYHASASFAGSSTTDNSVFPGNNTNTAILQKITVTCTQTTAGIVTLTLVKRSAADTSGTSSAMTKVPDDANYAAAVSAPLTYTGTGPSVGTPVGNLDVAQFGCNAAATVGANDIYVFKPVKPIVLRGTAQQVGINFGGAITGGTLTVTYDWLETTTP